MHLCSSLRSCRNSNEHFLCLDGYLQSSGRSSADIFRAGALQISVKTLMNKDRKDIEKALSLRQDLIRYARNFPLSLARLWTPYCHRWDGLSENSKRKKGCGRKMTFVSESVWELAGSSLGSGKKTWNDE